jgi:spermidine synthase
MTRALYGGTIFLSAFLLFLVEPMAAKELLPALGGTSAVWLTCLVFFQATLLLGYGYAHWMTREGGSGRGHLWLLGGSAEVLAVLLTGLLAGPVWLGSRGMDIHLNTRGSEHPVTTIFVGLGLTIGLPFLTLGATSPLLQVWLARKEGGRVPYRLFGLSNVGSLLALALYPTLIEPRFTLREQWVGWVAGSAVFAVMCGWIAWGSSWAGKGMAVRAGREYPTLSDEAGKDGPPEVEGGSPWVRWMWLLLPMGAAMQLSAVTSHLTQDIAAIPLLWVLPLGVYLMTFIVAFEAPWAYRRPIVVRLMAVMLASLGYALSKIDTTLPVGLAVGFYLAEVFVACWFCHAEVYRLRPARASESTVFYLMVAAGGVAGAFLVGIASPLTFRANYDLALVFLVSALLALVVTWDDGPGQRLLWGTGSALLVALAVVLHLGYDRHSMMLERNFYGSLRVVQSDTDVEAISQGAGSVGTGPVRVLMNGRIRHGTQMLEHRRVPTTYYGENSGVGLAMRFCCGGRSRTVGVVGLGAGTLAAYGEAGDTMRFYEINPAVEPIARNLFTYLRDSPAAITVVEGDGRAALAAEPVNGFDVLVVDAFSGDAIPLHLLTREAMVVYLRQLKPGGVLAFHVSNSYLDLAPEVGRLAAAVGLEPRTVESVAVGNDGVYRATWVLVTGNAEFLAIPEVASASLPMEKIPGLRLWTDDYSSLLPVFRWGR